MDELERYEEEERLRRGYSESHWSAMQRRINLQVLGAFIRDGSHDECISHDSFQKRDQVAFERLQNLVHNTCSEKDAEEILNQAIGYSSVVEEIYFNLGLKAGVTLHTKLTDTFETDV